VETVKRGPHTGGTFWQATSGVIPLVAYRKLNGYIRIPKTV